MNPFESAQGAHQAYDFWLRLIPQFLGQFAGAVPGAAASADTGASNPFASISGLMFPADQIGKAATMTQQSLQPLAQSLASMLEAGGAANLLNQWSKAVPAFASVKPADAAATTQALLAPWAALMSQTTAAQDSSTRVAQAMSLQTLSQAWADLGKQLTGATPEQFEAAFERTFGALSDAFGLGPARKLSVAMREAFAAGVAQQEAQARYAQLVQDAFAQGFQRLLVALAEKADAGERIESVFALLRLWARKTEEAVHDTLQSEAGLTATAELTRRAFSYRNKLRHATAAYADVLDVVTRHELDDAYREIQALKREVRRSRAERSSADAALKRVATRKATTAKKTVKKSARAQRGNAGRRA